MDWALGVQAGSGLMLGFGVLTLNPQALPEAPSTLEPSPKAPKPLNPKAQKTQNPETPKTPKTPNPQTPKP